MGQHFFFLQISHPCCALPKRTPNKVHSVSCFTALYLFLCVGLGLCRPPFPPQFLHTLNETLIRNTCSLWFSKELGGPLPLACSSASPKVQETKRAVVTRLGSVLILAPPTHPPDTERHGAPLSALCAPVVSVYCLSFSFAEKSSLLSPRDYHIALSGGPRSWVPTSPHYRWPYP